MKKCLLIVVVAAFITFLFAVSCSKSKSTDSKGTNQTANTLVGTWLTVSIFADDVEVTLEDDPYNLMVNHGTYTFNANGTGTVVFTYGGGSMAYTWAIDGDEFVLNDGYRMQFTLEGDTFTTIEPGDQGGEEVYPEVVTVYTRVR